MASNSGNPRIQHLTDEMIDILSGDRILTTYKDTNERVKSEFRTIPGGVYDKKFFGSCFTNSCNCGAVRHKVGEKCKECGSMILSESQAWTRYGRIDLPYYYCNDLNFPNFIKFVRSKLKVKFELSDTFKLAMKGNTWNDKLIWDYCQFMYDEEKQCIICTDTIDDVEMCSYEGLLVIINQYYKDQLPRFKTYVNRSVIVVPMIVRAPFYTNVDGKLRLECSHITAVYKSILYATLKYYPEKVQNKSLNPAEHAMILASMRNFTNNSVMTLSRLLKPSKQNYARTMQGHRVGNSGRCTIVPAPELKIDQVKIPRHLFYESCRKEFIQYLMDNNSWDYQKARNAYEKQSNSDLIQSQFTEYVEHGNGGLGKYVIINRNPSLYELAMQACKVILTNDYTIGIPLLLCESFGGDFDGDTFSYYVVPDDKTSAIVDAMSPKNLIFYKKDQSYLYTPRHEIMMGLYQASKVYLDQNDNLIEFPNYEEAYQYKRRTRGFKWQTLCIINGQRTTLARYKLSELFDTDLNQWPLDKYLTSKEIPALYEKLTQLDDRTDRIQSIQEFALNIATVSGATAPKLSDLHADLDKSYIDRIRQVESNPDLSDDQKDVKVREIYDEFRKDALEGKDKDGNPRINTEIRRVVEESSRAKMTQLLEVCVNRLNVDPFHNIHISDTTIAEGMTPRDYEMLAIENRATQAVKVSSVPNSGSTTRQLAYIGSPYTLSDEIDKRNKGVLVPAKKCLGRTLVSGEIVDKSKAKGDDLLRIRSVVTASNKGDTIITRDCLSNLNKWKNGANVGISLITSLTENLTQAGLSLKHGGALFELDKLSNIAAPFDCTIEDHPFLVILKEYNGNKTAIYPKPSNFVTNFIADPYYKKGKKVGFGYKLSTPSYKLDSIISLIGARSVSSPKRFLNNSVLISECYCYEEGEIRYNRVANGVSSVTIGNRTYKYNPNSVYFYPEGTKIKKYQRFCTGLLDLNAAIKSLKDYEQVFYVFWHQFNELFPSINSELIEFTYTLVVKLNNGRMSRKTVVSAINESPSIYTKVSFQNSKKTLRSIDYQGAEFKSDTFTQLLLPSFFNLEIL